MIAVFPAWTATYNSLVLNTRQIFIASKEAIAGVSARGRPAECGREDGARECDAFCVNVAHGWRQKFGLRASSCRRFVLVVSLYAWPLLTLFVEKGRKDERKIEGRESVDL